MHPEENRPLSQKPQFGGSVEVIAPTPLLIEFAGNGRVWAFPIHALCCFVLEANPDNPERKRTLPPSQLTLTYYTATVVLKGWRLDFMLEPLASGRIASVHAVDSPIVHLMIEEPWVTELRVHPFDEMNSTTPQPTSPLEN